MNFLFFSLAATKTTHASVRRDPTDTIVSSSRTSTSVQPIPATMELPVPPACPDTHVPARLGSREGTVKSTPMTVR